MSGAATAATSIVLKKLSHADPVKSSPRAPHSTAKYNLATVYIIGRVEAGEYPLAIAYSTVLIFFMLAVLLAVQKAVGEARLGRRTENLIATGH